jgi:PAS domain S-box-containing protein
MANRRKIPAKENLRPIFNSSLFFKMMFQNAEYTGILVMDPTGYILDANYGFKKCFGYSKEMLIGENFSMLFIEEDLKKQLPEKELIGVMEKGSHNDDNYLKRADGTPIWVHGESVYIKDEKEQEFVLKIVQDINEEKVLENELKRINEEQERVILDREMFVYTASHDLQAPINNIEGLVREIKESKGDEDPALFLSMMEKSIERFRNKISELSDIGREQEKARNQMEEVALRQVYEDVLLDLEDEIRDSRAVITADFNQAPKVIIIPRNLRSILQNFLSNAIRYRDSHRKPKIDLTSSKTDNHVLLSVSDNGIGIAEADKDIVFEMYGRLRHDSKGTGVGMAIVKRMVDNMGGRIELESKVGEGSTFRVYFPIGSTLH